MNKYKTFEKLKEELGDKFEEYMYKANIQLLERINKAVELMEIMSKGNEKYNGKIYLTDYQIAVIISRLRDENDE